MAFAASQFINYFNYTNLGRILSINGANVLQELNIGPIPLMLVFIFVSGFMNLFMTSASAKYAIFSAPCLMPMFMTLGISQADPGCIPDRRQLHQHYCARTFLLPIILQAMKPLRQGQRLWNAGFLYASLHRGVYGFLVHHAGDLDIVKAAVGTRRIYLYVI